MESKWPFMLIAFGLTFALGLIIAGLERTAVMNNWSSRRCDIPVMMAAMFFKPQDDPRTKGDFTKDNFDFCIKTYVEKFMALFMAPINTIFGKHTNIAGNAVNALSTIRNIATTMYNVLLSYLDQYYRRFNASVYEMSRIVQYLRMAMGRANAMVMSMLYTGLTMFRGMLNTIQFVIRVIMIIVGIMLAIIIILIFILFPVIPLILAVLGAIVATVLSLTMVMAGDLAQQAESDKGGFCFSETTMIITLDENGKHILKPVADVKIGDKLAHNCGTVTATIKMDGTNIPLYHINGIFVSGSHLVKGTDGIWKSVAKDERASVTSITSETLYCFNTTSRNIPVYCQTISAKDVKVLLFRDWEEIADEDAFGQYEWQRIVLSLLNNNKHEDVWQQSLGSNDTIPLMSSTTKIKTARGFVDIESITKLRSKILDRSGKEQVVLGLVRAEVENTSKNQPIWDTGLIEDVNGVWIRNTGTVSKGTDKVQGLTLITETGEFIIWDEVNQKERIVRDFTEVGYKSIHKTYPFVADRLRTTTEAR